MDHDKVNLEVKSDSKSFADSVRRANEALQEFSRVFRKFSGKKSQVTPRTRKPRNPLRHDPKWQKRRKKAMAGRKTNVKRLLALKNRK